MNKRRIRDLSFWLICSAIIWVLWHFISFAAAISFVAAYEFLIIAVLVRTMVGSRRATEDALDAARVWRRMYEGLLKRTYGADRRRSPPN